MVRVVLAMLVVTSGVFAAAVREVPEIDANTGVSAITMLAGGMLVLRGRFGKKQ